MAICLCGEPLNKDTPDECKRIMLKEAGWQRNDRTAFGVHSEVWVDPNKDRDRYGKYVPLALAWKRFLKEKETNHDDHTKRL